MKRISHKKEMFEGRLVQELNKLLRSATSDSRLQFVSVTKVELSPDYAYAKVYWDTFDSGTRGNAKRAIESMQGRARSFLAKSMSVRHVPALTFIYDAQFEEEQKIMNLLKAEAKKTDPDLF